MAKPQNKTQRIVVHISKQEEQLIEALIKEHEMETGVSLSKSQFVRVHLTPSLRIARDYLVEEYQ